MFDLFIEKRLFFLEYLFVLFCLGADDSHVLYCYGCKYTFCNNVGFVSLSFSLSFSQSESIMECPQNCHGNGDCLSGICHCFPGFLGPDCSRGKETQKRTLAPMFTTCLIWFLLANIFLDWLWTLQTDQHHKQPISSTSHIVFFLVCFFVHYIYLLLIKLTKMRRHAVLYYTYRYPDRFWSISALCSFFFLLPVFLLPQCVYQFCIT